MYLGIISDLTVGPFAGIAPQIVGGQEAFWNQVNTDGGIGGYDMRSGSSASPSSASHRTRSRQVRGKLGDL